MERTKWLDRKFNFEFPVGVLPSILERLRGTPVRLEAMTMNLLDEEAGTRFNNKWSIKEEIGHFSDLEILHIGRIDDFMARKDILRAADMANKATVEANHNQKGVRQLLDEFTSKRALLVSGLEGLDEQIHNFRSTHPRLQVPVRPVDIAYFTAEHDDHHFASIREILRLLK